MSLAELFAWLSGDRALYSPHGGEVREVSASDYLAGPLPEALILVADPARAERIAEIQRGRLRGAS